jgi:competence protein ComEA
VPTSLTGLAMMDLQPGARPPTAASRTLRAPEPAFAATWPRSVQLALSVLLAACLLVLAGKCLLQSLQAGPSTIPSQRIDLNSATHAELILLPGVGEQLAERIARARAQGPFQKVDDLRQVPGIGPATLERLRPWVFVAAGIAPMIQEIGPPLAVEPSKRPGTKPNKVAGLTEPIDINTADATQLMRLPGIGPVLSRRIVAERANKPFQTVGELRRVKGIGPKTLDKITPFVIASAVEHLRR